jgi:hypothetical protein
MMVVDPIAVEQHRVSHVLAQVMLSLGFLLWCRISAVMKGWMFAGTPSLISRFQPAVTFTWRRPGHEDFAVWLTFEAKPHSTLRVFGEHQTSLRVIYAVAYAGRFDLRTKDYRSDGLLVGMHHSRNVVSLVTTDFPSQIRVVEHRPYIDLAPITRVLSERHF